jgi:hypothetical protein
MPSSPLRPFFPIFFSASYSQNSYMYSSHNMRDQVSHPYKTAAKIIVLYIDILIFTFLCSRWGDKKSLNCLPCGRSMSHNVAPNRFLGVCSKQSSTIDLCHNLVCYHYSHSKLEIITKIKKKLEGSTLPEAGPPAYISLAQLEPSCILHYTISSTHLTLTIYFPMIHFNIILPSPSIIQILRASLSKIDVLDLTTITMKGEVF